MNAEPGPEIPTTPPEGAPSEEELRRRLEEELRKLRVQDVLLQSVVSLINLTSRRIAKPDERDLEQARIGIDAIGALAEFLDEEAATQVQNALSELRIAYAREASGPADGDEAGSEGESKSPPGEPESASEPPPQPPRPGAKPPPGLWTPPGTG